VGTHLNSPEVILVSIKTIELGLSGFTIFFNPSLKSFSGLSVVGGLFLVWCICRKASGKRKARKQTNFVLEQYLYSCVFSRPQNNIFKKLKQIRIIKSKN
jgi:hypothetical protein